MKTIALLAAVLALTPLASFAQGAAVKDVTKASWVTGAADAFKADPTQITAATAQTPSPATQGTPEMRKPAEAGRLAAVLKERGIPVKKVWRERKAKMPGAPRKKSKAPKPS